MTMLNSKESLSFVKLLGIRGHGFCCVTLVRARGLSCGHVQWNFTLFDFMIDSSVRTRISKVLRVDHMVELIK